jgi:DNA-binding PadR family transcriptional regulator
LVSIDPAAGHELAAFAERSVGQFFSLTRSHVYSELERLCRLGLVRATEVEQTRFPTKRVYDVTSEGLEALDRWLDDAELTPERQRNMFLVRVFFGDRMSEERLSGLFDAYENAIRERRDRYADIVERLADHPQSAFPRATAMFGLAHAQASLEWMSQVRPLLLGAREQCSALSPT